MNTKEHEESRTETISIKVSPTMKKDFRKDGHCTAKVHEEKDCLGFTPVHNGIRELTLCLNQNMGRICEVKK